MRNTLLGVKTIYLMLGNACNFKCKHCIQHDAHPRIKKRVAPKVIEWLKHIGRSRPERFKPRLMFWGGEPLLYKDIMKDVVGELGNLFDYSMVSNGALLTDEDVEWMNANNVFYIYSNDGVNTHLVRDKNMFEDEVFLTRFNRLNNKGVDGVVHAMNQDLYAFWDYVQSKSPDAAIYLEDLICSECVPSAYSDFDLVKLKETYKQIEADVIGGLINSTANHPMIYMTNAVGRVEKAKPHNGLPPCGCCRSTLDVDINGNIYLCHNSDTVIGTIEEDFEEYSKRGLEIIKDIMSKRIADKKCKECEAFLYCKGGCPFEVASVIQEKSCEAKKIFWNTAKNIIQAFGENNNENSVQKSKEV